MSDPKQDWLEETFAYDAGNGVRWSWLHESAGNRINILWYHECADPSMRTRWIDITSGEKHRLISDEPLTIQPSILCQACGLHGFITDGRWVSA